MKPNKIVGLLVVLLSVVYPLFIRTFYPDHYLVSGDFLIYVFSPLIALFGILYFINDKAGIYYGRIIVGSVFIVSGLIKANDTLGFSYKLEEYFEAGALGWTFFEPYALVIAIMVCIGEVVLGLSLLFGTKFKLTLVFLMGMLVFFAFLTFYTAQCDPNATYSVVENGVSVEKPVQCVLDCGCFGDALKGSIGRSLTPWESFYKDLTLLILTLFLFGSWNRIKLNNERRDRVILPLSAIVVTLFGGYIFGWFFPLFFTAICFTIVVVFKRFYARENREWMIAILMGTATLAFSLYTLSYLPIKDYRPYAIGNDLNELKKTSDEIKEELTQSYFDKIFSSYTKKIKAEQEEAILSSPILTNDSISDSIKAITKEELLYAVTSKYEDFAYNQADSMANDSMTRANLHSPKYAFNYLMKNKKTGEEKEFTSDEYMNIYKEWDILNVLKNKKTGETKKLVSGSYDLEEMEKKGFEKLEPVSYLVKDGYTPKIPADFDFNDDEANQNILHSDTYVLLVIAYDLNKTKAPAFATFKDLKNFADKESYVFYAATSTDYLSPEFIKKNGLNFSFLSADEKILKTIVRSNPGLLLLKNGVVYGKWGSKSIPTPEKLKAYIGKLANEMPMKGNNY